MAGYTSVYALVADFMATIGRVKVFREVPSNLAYDVPLDVVQRFGGGDRTITVDVARIDVDTFAATADTAEQLGEDLRAAFRTGLVRHMFGGSVVSRVETFSAPHLIPYDATNVFRVASAYQVTLHKYAGVS